MRELVRSRADAAGLALLALLALGSAVLALLGYAVGLWMLALLVGFLVAWVAAYLLTKPRPYRAWVAVSLGVAALLPFFVSVFGLARGVEWMILDFGSDSVGGALWFGVTLAVIQVVFGRLSGRGFWAEN